MVATDQRLVGRCAVEEGRTRPCCLWNVQVEPERPFRMQEADRRVDHDVAGEEHFFVARTDMYRHVAWRVTGGVEGGHTRRYLRPGLDQAQPGAGQFQVRLGNQRFLRRGSLPTRSGALQKATSVSLATNSAEGNSSDAFLPSLIPHRWSKWA
jgi:hypothetical protein